MANPTPEIDYKLPQSQKDIEDVANKIRSQSSQPMGKLTAHIKAVRLLAQL